jgi:hypothetical protein
VTALGKKIWFKRCLHCQQCVRRVRESPILLASHRRSSITTNCDESRPAAVNNYSSWLPVPDIHSGWERITPLQQYLPPRLVPQRFRALQKTWSWPILMQVRYYDRKHRRVNSLALVTPVIGDITTRMLTGGKETVYAGECETDRLQRLDNKVAEPGVRQQFMASAV